MVLSVRPRETAIFASFASHTPKLIYRSKPTGRLLCAVGRHKHFFVYLRRRSVRPERPISALLRRSASSTDVFAAERRTVNYDAVLSFSSSSSAHRGGPLRNLYWSDDELLGGRIGVALRVRAPAPSIYRSLCNIRRLYVQ